MISPCIGPGMEELQRALAVPVTLELNEKQFPYVGLVVFSKKLSE